jgi:hypothetical protein
VVARPEQRGQRQQQIGIVEQACRHSGLQSEGQGA